MNKYIMILYFLTEIFVTLNVIYCFGKLQDKPVEVNLKNFIILLLGTTILLINNIYNKTNFMLICSFLIMIIINKFIYKEKIKDTIINTMIYVFTGMAIELILTSLFLNNFHSIEILNKNMFLVKILLTIVVFSLNSLIYLSKKTRSMLIKSKKVLDQFYGYELLIIIIISIFDILAFKLSKNMNEILNITLVITSTIYICLTIFLIIKTQYSITRLKIKNKMLCDSYKVYSDTFEEFKELKHNLKNDLLGIKMNLSKENQDTINKIINKYNKNSTWVNNINSIPKGLEGMLILKQNEAKYLGINMFITFKSNVNISKKDFVDMNDILGIYLDNAIEASKNLKNKNILVNVYDLNLKETVFEIINQYENTIDVDKLYSKNYSTKEKPSGIGLNYVNKIKNKNIKFKTKIYENIYISEIIYKSSKAKSK